jgi:hypothetical protein
MAVVLAPRAQQRLDRAALVHGTVALRHLVERQREVEHLAGVDLPVAHEPDQLGQVLAHWRGAAVQGDMLEEQLLPVERDPLRDADVAHVPALTGGMDRLHHRFLGADALQHRVGAEALGQILGYGPRPRRRARSRWRSRRTRGRAPAAPRDGSSR